MRMPQTGSINRDCPRFFPLLRLLLLLGRFIKHVFIQKLINRKKKILKNSVQVTSISHNIRRAANGLVFQRMLIFITTQSDLGEQLGSSAIIVIILIYLF